MPVGGCRVSGRKAPSQWPGLFALRASSSKRDRADDIGASAPFVSREQGPERTVRRAAWAPAGRRHAPASALWEQPPQSTRQQCAAAAAARGDGPVSLAPTGAARSLPAPHSATCNACLGEGPHAHNTPMSRLSWPGARAGANARGTSFRSCRRRPARREPPRPARRGG